MSRRSNLNTKRIGYFTTWTSYWHNNTNIYKNLLQKDIQLQNFLSNLCYKLKLITSNFSVKLVKINYLLITGNICFFARGLSKRNRYTMQYLCVYLLRFYFLMLKLLFFFDLLYKYSIFNFKTQALKKKKILFSNLTVNNINKKKKLLYIYLKPQNKLVTNITFCNIWYVAFNNYLLNKKIISENKTYTKNRKSYYYLNNYNGIFLTKIKKNTTQQKINTQVLGNNKIKLLRNSNLTQYYNIVLKKKEKKKIVSFLYKKQCKKSFKKKYTYKKNKIYILQNIYWLAKLLNKKLTNIASINKKKHNYLLAIKKIVSMKYKRLKNILCYTKKTYDLKDKRQNIIFNNVINTRRIYIFVTRLINMCLRKINRCKQENKKNNSKNVVVIKKHKQSSFKINKKTQYSFFFQWVLCFVMLICVALLSYNKKNTLQIKHKSIFIYHITNNHIQNLVQIKTVNKYNSIIKKRTVAKYNEQKTHITINDKILMLLKKTQVKKTGIILNKNKIIKKYMQQFCYKIQQSICLFLNMHVFFLPTIIVKKYEFPPIDNANFIGNYLRLNLEKSKRKQVKVVNIYKFFNKIQKTQRINKLSKMLTTKLYSKLLQQKVNNYLYKKYKFFFNFIISKNKIKNLLRIFIIKKKTTLYNNAFFNTNNKNSKYKNLVALWKNTLKYKNVHDYELYQLYLSWKYQISNNVELLYKPTNVLSGIRMECNGTTKTGLMSKLLTYSNWVRDSKFTGKMPNTTILANVQYYQTYANTRRGSIGIKVWVYLDTPIYNAKLINLAKC